jgi:hypothetical protein
METRWSYIFITKNLLILIVSLADTWLFPILSILVIPNTLVRTRLAIIIRGTRCFLCPTSNPSRYKKNISILRLKKL